MTVYGQNVYSFGLRRVGRPRAGGQRPQRPRAGGQRPQRPRRQRRRPRRPLVAAAAGCGGRCGGRWLLRRLAAAAAAAGVCTVARGCVCGRGRPPVWVAEGRKCRGIHLPQDRRSASGRPWAGGRLPIVAGRGRVACPFGVSSPPPRTRRRVGAFSGASASDARIGSPFPTGGEGGGPDVVSGPGEFAESTPLVSDSYAVCSRNRKPEMAPPLKKSPLLVGVAKERGFWGGDLRQGCVAGVNNKADRKTVLCVAFLFRCWRF